MRPGCQKIQATSFAFLPPALGCSSCEPSVSLEDGSQRPPLRQHSLCPLLALQLFEEDDIVLPVINLLMSHPTLARALEVALAIHIHVVPE